MSKIAVLIDAENLKKSYIYSTGSEPNYKKIFSYLTKLYDRQVELIYFVGFLKKYNSKNHFETNFFYSVKKHLAEISSIG